MDSIISAITGLSWSELTLGIVGVVIGLKKIIKAVTPDEKEDASKALKVLNKIQSVLDKIS